MTNASAQDDCFAFGRVVTMRPAKYFQNTAAAEAEMRAAVAAL